jgi:hypothetical protein
MAVSDAAGVSVWKLLVVVIVVPDAFTAVARTV